MGRGFRGALRAWADCCECCAEGDCDCLGGSELFEGCGEWNGEDFDDCESCDDAGCMGG